MGELSDEQEQALRERWLREDYIGIGPLRDDLTALLADRAAKQRRIAKDANDILRLVTDLEYVRGIVERGTGKKMHADAFVRGEILKYVKGLEWRIAELEAEMEAARDVVAAAGNLKKADGALSELGIPEGLFDLVRALQTYYGVVAALRSEVNANE